MIAYQCPMSTVKYFRHAPIVPMDLGLPVSHSRHWSRLWNIVVRFVVGHVEADGLDRNDGVRKL